MEWASEDNLLKCGEILFKKVDNERHYSFICTECYKLYKNFIDFVDHFALEHDILVSEDANTQETFNTIEFIEKIDDGTQRFNLEDIIQESLEIDDIIIHEEEEIYSEDNGEDDEEIKSLVFEEIEEKDADPLAEKNALKLVTIIEYGKHPILWNNKLSVRKSRPLREKAFAAITKSVNKQLKLKLTVDNIKNTIKMISNSYRNEAHKQKLAELNGEERIPPWYFEKLKFLDVKKEVSEKSEEEKLSRKPLGLPLACFDDEQHSELFEIYKEFSSLWDVYDVRYHTKMNRDKAINDMVEVVNDKMDLDFTADKLRRKLYEIRYACSKEKYQKLECERTQTPFTPTCKYWPEIEFLEPHVQPFKCSYCDKVFGFVRQYVQHRSEHEDSLPFKCSVCNQGFRVAHKCLLHMRKHTKEAPYTCKICAKSFTNVTGLTHHMRRHNGERPYVCDVCGQRFFTQTQLSYHKRRHTNERPFVCSVCSKAFYDNSLLKRHMLLHLNLRDKVCNICGKGFNVTKNLNQHMQTHARKKKYQCTECEKIFLNGDALIEHMKIHDIKLDTVPEVGEEWQRGTLD